MNSCLTSILILFYQKTDALIVNLYLLNDTFQEYSPFLHILVLMILCILEETNFFKDYEIENFDFTIKYLNDKLTEKFILGELDEESDDLFEEEEFNVILREIVAGSILTELKNKGLVNSYEDDNTEELFFLTKKGKKMLKDDGDFNIR